jgi:hypothetical protein
MQMEKSRTVEIRYSKEGIRPRLEMTVPYGTTLAETFKLHDFLSKDLISKLSPRGCLQCNSGVDIWIHEAFEDVIRVDLDTLRPVR